MKKLKANAFIHFKPKAEEKWLSNKPFLRYLRPTKKNLIKIQRKIMFQNIAVESIFPTHKLADKKSLVFFVAAVL